MVWYGVSARTDVGEVDIYEGTDAERAEREAVAAHVRYRGAAYVSVLLDGGTWMDVKHVPGELRTARLMEPSCCLHPQCGQIIPLACYCVATMDAETIARYRAEYM